jgi:hypothetical protein
MSTVAHRAGIRNPSHEQTLREHSSTEFAPLRPRLLGKRLLLDFSRWFDSSYFLLFGAYVRLVS